MFWDVVAVTRFSHIVGVMTGRAIRNRHNVIFPLCTSGIIYDLIAQLRQYLATIGVEIGSEDPSQLVIYMASPVADKSLQYSNICGEW
jgi:integrator complex subunit 9